MKYRYQRNWDLGPFFALTSTGFFWGRIYSIPYGLEIKWGKRPTIRILKAKD